MLEYSSERKRMSVVVEPEGGESDQNVLLVCKGADSTVSPLLLRADAPTNAPESLLTTRLREFGSEGLRTMCYAYRVREGHCQCSFC